MTRRSANLLLLLAGAVWGLGFIAQSTAMEDVGPFTFISSRFIIASLVLLPLALFENKHANHKLPTIAYLQFISIGAVLFTALALQQIGLLTTTVTNSGVLTGLYVVIVPFLALLLFREIPHYIIWPSVILTFIGIFLLSGGELSTLTDGDILTIICAAGNALQVILISRYASKYKRPLTFSFIQFATIATLGTVASLQFETTPIPSFIPALPEILYAGIFSSALTFTIQAVAQRYTTAAQTAIFMSSEVLFAAAFGAILLGERIPAIGYLGGLLIFSAMMLTETIPHIKRKTTRP